jgi:hypothetical protein
VIAWYYNILSFFRAIFSLHSPLFFICIYYYCYYCYCYLLLFCVTTVGDYAETPIDCPATTTCPVICVATVEECPTVCDNGTILCYDGSCAADTCLSEDEYENPCECETLAVACPKVINFYDECFTLYQIPYYSNYTSCIDAQEEAIPLLSFTGPYFMTCYIWISVVTILVYGWCFYNQKLSPVPSATQPLPRAHHHTAMDNNNSNEIWTQTGYKVHIIGMIIYILVIITIVGIQFLLFLLTIFYYMQQELITKWAPVFLDEVQVLKAFEIVWMVGFPWTIAFRYTNSIYTLFLRRCPIQEASYVVIVAPTKAVESVGASPLSERLAYMIWTPIDTILRFFFSYPYREPGKDATYCRITIDPYTQSRSTYHRMRRYALDDDTTNTSRGMIPGYMSVGTTLGEFCSQIDGLSSEEVKQRMGRVGPNIIPMIQPTAFSALRNEFSKTFYVYQNFMVWTWAPYYYYYMAIVSTVVRITGGLVAAAFQYMSDTTLYQLAHVSGSVL